MSSSVPKTPLVIGRYALYDEIAAGGMATVHYGRLVGAEGFARIVALKRLHAQYAKDPDFVSMFLDEARLAARIRHPNVVPTLDVVAHEGELFLVMEYVPGESLARLLRRAAEDRSTIPTPIVSALVCGALEGLHAAHEATNEKGEPLDIIHRDVSPQNILVGVDGVPRVLDFGVARAVGRLHTTRDGQVKGKLAYMAPEQLRNGEVDRRADIYAAGVVLWELLTGKRLFDGENEGAIIAQVIENRIEPPSTVVPDIPRALDDVVMQALSREPSRRFGTCRQMASALERCVAPATGIQIGEWVEELAGDAITKRRRLVDGIESGAFAIPSAPASVAAVVTSEVTSFVPGPKTRALRGARKWWAAIAAFGAGVAATIALVGIAPSLRAPASASASALASASASASPSAPASAPASASPPASTEIATAPPDPSPPETPSATSSASAPDSSSRKAKPRPASHAAKPCVVRSSVDDTGVKRFYKDCK